MVNAGKDVLFALRMLARNPGFTVVALATLALGIGTNTAIFSVVDGVLLKPLPFRDPGRLSMVWQKAASAPKLEISELDLDDYRARNHAFEGLAGYTTPGVYGAILTGSGNPVEIAPSYITRDYFSLLGVAPVIGRDFLPAEYNRGHNHVAILSYSLWHSRFGGSPAVLNRWITLNNQSLQVVGVMSADVYPVEADVFVPFTYISPEKALPRNYHQLSVLGRLRPGRSVADAQVEMDALSAELRRAYPVTNAGIGAYVTPLRDEIIGKLREPLLLLLAAVGLVLLIACANITNLLLVRAAARRKEMAIRIALGAGRARMISQFVIECLILSAGGALLGSLLAFFCLPLIRALGAGRIPRLQHVTMDFGVLMFTAAVAVFSGLLFGLIPALRYSSANLSLALRSGGRNSTSDSGRLRNVLVAAEVALALVAVVAASLLVRSLNKLIDVHPGFRADHLLVARLTLPTNQYQQVRVNSFYERLLPRISAIPGVVSVAAATSVPLASVVAQTRFLVQGAPLPDPASYPVTAFASVDTGFFETMGIPVVRGRVFNREEVGSDVERCIVNSTLARNFFAGQDPIGRTILTNLAVTPPEPCRIVGVVGDTRVAGLDAPPQPMIYFASYVAHELLVVRTLGDPMTVVPAIQREVTATDPAQPLSAIRPMDAVLSQLLSRRSFAAVLLAVFSALGLLLAALGLYGMVAYSVAHRTQEIGVRMALGAAPASVFRMVLSQGLSVTAIGLAAGIAAALLATRVMSSLLFGIGTADPLSFVVGSALLLAVSMVACFIPAWRATRVDPLVALRYE